MYFINSFLALFFGLFSGILLGKYGLFNTVIYQGPNSNIIRETIYKTGNKYVMFDIIMCVCPPSTKNLFKEKLKNKSK